MEIKCHKISGGCAVGEALVTRETISFLGNVDPDTGVVVEPGHELYGRCIAGKVLIFPEAYRRASISSVVTCS